MVTIESPAGSSLQRGSRHNERMNIMLNGTDTDGNGTASSRLDRILIVEDDGLLAMVVEDMARDQGARDVVVCRDLDHALDQARTADFDCAVLDVSLSSGPTYPVAEALAARNVPFIFSTGMSRLDIDPRFRDRPLLQKPYSDTDFAARLQQALAG
jgi:DNA-binding response OmpR family regulator